MKRLCVIPARGGSKRIPHKNIREFSGKPVIAYAIEAALKSRLFDRVMVSTDDEEIAEVAKRYGAEVPFMRSAKTADDFATTSDVLLEVLNRLTEEAGEAALPELTVCLYATTPFVTAKRLRDAVERFETQAADLLLPVVRFSYPPQRAFRIEDGALQLADPEARDKRSQDLPPLYHDAGQFYVFRTASFLASHQILSGRMIPLELPEEEVQDIDTEADWRIAEMKYALYAEANRSAAANCTFREATMEDAETLLVLRNDPEARRNSFQTEVIDLATHTKWLQGVLEDPARRLYLVEKDGTAAGQMRLDFAGGFASISMTVAPAFRGQGIGDVITAYAEDRAAERVKELRCDILKHNTACLHIYRNRGYSFEDKGTHFLCRKQLPGAV